MFTKPSLQANDVLGGRYRIVSLVGEGGMSSVYLAEDLKLLHKKWAVKEVRTPLGLEHLFTQEAKILARLQHPNLPSIVDFFAPKGEGVGYLVMDFIDGITLERWLLDKKNLHDRSHLPEVLRIAIQLCRCLRYLHEIEPKPIIYRDLKPTNVMIDEKLHVYLVDFGIARHYDPGKRQDTVRLGTITFASPEQMEGKQTDARSDIYSLGALLYYLLTDGQYYNAVHRPISDQQLFDQRHWPAALIRFIHKLLAYDRRDRIQTIAEAEKQLMDIAGQEGIGEFQRIHTQPIYTRSSRASIATIDTNAHVKKMERSSQTDQRMIWIASLSSGAGATYATLSLARVLNDWGISHAVLEYPGNVPELYHLLSGERTCPQSYQFLKHRTPFSTCTEWENGHTTWFPLHPESISNGNEAHGENILRLIAHHPDQFPITLIDHSMVRFPSNMDHFVVGRDIFLFVADAHPAKFNQKQSARRMERAMQLKELGMEVHFVANRFYTWKGQKQWLQAFPWKPICLLPIVDYKKILQTAYAGKLIQDEPLVLKQNKRAWWPFVRAFVEMGSQIHYK